MHTEAEAHAQQSATHVQQKAAQQAEVEAQGEAPPYEVDVSDDGVKAEVSAQPLAAPLDASASHASTTAPPPTTSGTLPPAASAASPAASAAPSTSASPPPSQLPNTPPQQTPPKHTPSEARHPALKALVDLWKEFEVLIKSSSTGPVAAERLGGAAIAGLIVFRISCLPLSHSRSQVRHPALKALVDFWKEFEVPIKSSIFSMDFLVP
ncbi:unnamed protein product [Closterium sp. Naga37s-1]|nr:unnamed protein product [Closterium sp. Naga37s-1]